MSSLHVANLCSLHPFSGIVLPVWWIAVLRVDILTSLGNTREIIQVFHGLKALAVIYFVQTFYELENTLISELLKCFQALTEFEYCQKLIWVLNDFMMHFSSTITWQITFTLILSYEPSQSQILLVTIHFIMVHCCLYIEWLCLWLCCWEFCLFIKGKWW